MKLVLLLALLAPVETVLAAKPQKLQPSVSISSPVNGSSYNVNASINISASATNASKVQFFANNVLLCDDSLAPFSCAYTAPASAQSVAIKAVAVAKGGLSAQQSVNISIIAQAPAPVPVSGAVEVYPGCGAPSSYGRQVVLDGNQGQTLLNAINQNL